jgi:polar amino acid transport system substrate-binding protein
VAPPASVAKAGAIVYCTAPPYPPVIMQNGSQFSGSDIDIGNAIAALMGVKAQWIAIGFDGFIAAVKSGKCDGYLGASTDTPERAQQVHFTDYVSVGRQYLVTAANPAGIHSEADLCGHTVSLLIGTTEADAVKAQSQQCVAQGKQPVNLQVFDQDATAGLALVEGKVDAYVTDAPGLVFYLQKYPNQFAEALPDPVAKAPWGIATRKDNTQLNDALAKAVHLLYANGTMAGILSKWQLSNIALNPAP